MSARGVKRLEAPVAAMQHQRAWFTGLHERVRGGEPLVVADADVPHEIFRAFEMPYVVNQWWASICSAKQRAPHYLAAVRERGYPDDVDQYSAIGLGSVLADDDDKPWGGLPPVSVFATQRWTDAHARHRGGLGGRDRVRDLRLRERRSTAAYRSGGGSGRATSGRTSSAASAST